MQNADSMQLSNSVLVSQSNSPASPARKYQCAHCPLILKSKVYLFEHLTKVHGLKIDAALKNSGLKSFRSTSFVTDLKCHHCDFMAYSQDGLKDHLSQCLKKSKDSGLCGSPTSEEKPDTSITENELKEHSNKSSKFKSLDRSKHPKIYSKPMQTITKFLVSTTKSTKKPINVDDSKETVQETSSSSIPNSDHVAEFIDLNTVPPLCPLQNDTLWTGTQNNPNTKEKSEEEPPNTLGKCTNPESSEDSPVQKVNVSTKSTPLPQKENTSNSKSCNSFDFDLSEDESEKRKPANVDSVVYFCKHCDYSDVGVRGMSNHYNSNHPYIRYKAIYIQDSSDESATFRCIECPVEFINTANLKRHYKKEHPDAPNVFTKKFCELNLAFKCFVCPFTTTFLKKLKEHHDEMHPKYTVGNSLLYCRYSVTGCPKESCQLSEPEKKPETIRSKDVFIENGCLPCKEIKNTTSPQPTSKGAGTLFKCNSCTFSHKSVVVMHVHYQKSHPEEAMTIDKIKQLARFTENALQTMTPEKLANSKTALENPIVLRRPSDPSKEGNVEPLPEKDIKITLATGHSRSKSAANEVDKSLKTKKKSDNPLIKQDVEFLRNEHNYPSYSNADMFYCRFCSFESFKLESVVSHQNAKHFLQTTANTDEIRRYSAGVQTKKAKSKNEVSKTTQSSCSETDEKVVGKCHANDTTGTYMTGYNAYADPGKLFYCSECNYANPAARGIQYHQAKVHVGNCTNMKKLIQYTAMVCKEVERSKSQPKELPFCTYLPRPHIHKRDRLKFFCHFCNYRHGDISIVLRHYRKAHEGYKVNRSTIEMYTSLVLKQARKSHSIAKQHKEADGKSLEKAKTETRTKIPKTSSRKRKLLRILLCYKCPYKTQCVYLLRRHLAQAHNKKHQATEILKYCFEQGALQPGYHCEYCVFSHINGPTVFKHYREQHPDKKLSLNYVLTQLHVGSPEPPNKKVEQEVTSTDTSSDDDNDDKSPSGQNEAKTYPCSECSFKGSSLSSVIQHFRTDHPWTETHSQTQDVTEARPLFDSFQEPLDFERSADDSDDDNDSDKVDDDEESSREFKCPFCPAVLSTHHGLNTHCGLKHQNVNKTLESTKNVKTHVRLYRCQHCSYVNTCLQAVLLHCKKKHSDLTAKPDRIDVDMKQVQNLSWLKMHRSGMLKFNAFMCTTCSRFCRTVRKLNRHRLAEHCPPTEDTAQSNFKTDSKPPIKCKIVLHKVRGAEKLNISTAFLSKKGNSVLKCLYCHYICTTSLKLSRHVRLQHNKYAVSKGSLYTCVLCSKKYFTRKHLADHFIMKHGKEAYLTHFVPLYMQPKQTVTSSGSQSSLKCADSSTSAEESKIQIHLCPFCSYVHTSPHGTLTHCQMRHPSATVKADILQKDKIPRASFVGFKKGVISKQGGYMCKKCSQICASSGKYKLHCQQRCKIASKDLDKPKNVAPHNFQSLTSLDFNVKDEMSEVEIQSTHVNARETNSSRCLLTQPVSKIYKCQMCNYSALYRRYLQAHYYKFHKLDAGTTLKLLQKYNKRKSFRTSGKLELSEEKCEPISHNKCIKCPDSTFDSNEQLIEHYCTIHHSDVKMDFVVLSTGEKKKSTGLYSCNHCSKQLNGTKKLSLHMDRHRETRKEEARKRACRQESTLDPNSIEPGVNDELPASDFLEEFIPGSKTSVDLSTNHIKSLSKLDNMKQSTPEFNSNKLACKHCGKSFMSPKVLLSHERSHATMAAIKNFGSKFTTELDSRVSKYIIYKSGVTKPFQCSICLYRTTVLGLWWSHFQKKHQDVVNQTEATDNGDVDEDSFRGVGTEPPDLLKQRLTVTDPGDKWKMAEMSIDFEPPDVRRQLNHYNLIAQRNAEAPVGEGRLRTDSLLYCEMCDFNTEHLSSIRRHYLNRHGKKMNRCKQCQFYTESRKVLGMHMLNSHSTGHSVTQKEICCPFCLYQTRNKNNMIEHINLHRDNRVVPVEIRRPKLSRYLRGVVFRCHRCTFMSSSAENLRLHMTRHDDMRPYKCLLCFFDCTQLSDLEVHLNDSHQVMRNHELVSQVSHNQLGEVSSRTPDMEEGTFSNPELCSNRSEAEDMEEDFTDFNEVQQAGSQNQGQEGNTVRPSMKTLLDIHTTEQKKHEVVPQARLRPESNEQDQEGLWGNEGAEMDKSLPTYSNITHDRENTEAQRVLNIEASVEDHILRNILELDGESSVCRTFKKSSVDATDKTKSDACRSSEQSHITQDLDIAKISLTQTNDAKAKKSFTSDIQTLPPSILPKQPSFSREDDSPTCQLEEEQSGTTSDEAEMPVLENEYLKDKMHLLEFSKLEKDCDRLADKDVTAMSCENDEKPCGQQESQNELTVKKNYSCELCGRKLASCSELELHTVRHGM